MKYLIYYLLSINVISMFFVVIDKINARKNKRRVPEKTLITLAFLGSALFQFITMNIIRHKTQKLKFVITYPLIIISQLILLYYIGKLCF